jgi:hypothetical protein
VLRPGLLFAQKKTTATAAAAQQQQQQQAQHSFSSERSRTFPQNKTHHTFARVGAEDLNRAPRTTQFRNRLFRGPSSLSPQHLTHRSSRRRCPLKFAPSFSTRKKGRATAAGVTLRSNHCITHAGWIGGLAVSRAACAPPRQKKNIRGVGAPALDKCRLPLVDIGFQPGGGTLGKIKGVQTRTLYNMDVIVSGRHRDRRWI